MNKPKILVKVVYKSGVVKKVFSRKRRRIVNFFKADNFKDCLIEVNVDYENDRYNRGVYKTKKDSLAALKAFLESGI